MATLASARRARASRAASRAPIARRTRGSLPTPVMGWGRTSARVAGAIGGRVYTFGWGDVGQLGHTTGFTPDMPDAYRASGPRRWRRWRAWTWCTSARGRGSRRGGGPAPGACTPGAPGSYGQLGHGDRRPGESRRASCARLVNVTSVAAGTRHTVAVDDMGETYAWGSNEFGELGLDPPPPLDPTKGPLYLTLRGWTQDDNLGCRSNERSSPSPVVAPHRHGG